MILNNILTNYQPSKNLPFAKVHVRHVSGKGINVILAGSVLGAVKGPIIGTLVPSICGGDNDDVIISV